MKNIIVWSATLVSLFLIAVVSHAETIISPGIEGTGVDARVDGFSSTAVKAVANGVYGTGVDARVDGVYGTGVKANAFGDRGTGIYAQGIYLAGEFQGDVKITGVLKIKRSPSLLQLIDHKTGGGTWNLYSGKTVTGDFSISESASFNADRIYIEPGGDVGIGTTTPAGKLDVNGKIFQRGEELHSDYVFENNYTIDDIEAHARKMWAEKHLPAVPGVQVDNNGLEILEIGAHRKGMLEELEIAHIYIEQLNDKIEQLTKRLMAMESMILQNPEGVAGK